MSAGLFVFFKSSRLLPTVEDWNAAIKAEGFDLVIDPFDLRTDDGYRPAMLYGRESTFDWYLSALEPERAPEWGLPAGVYDMEARLGFGTTADEDVTACIAGAVLAKLLEGSFQNNEIGNDILTASAALEATRIVVAQFHARPPFDYEGHAKQSAPPIISPAQPSASPPAIPSPSPSRSFRNYRITCALCVLMWLGFLVFGILIIQGVIAPSLGIVNTLLTANDPAAHARALARERERAWGAVALGAFGVFFYACAAFVPRTRSGWRIGKCAILGMLFPFFITYPFVNLLLKSWGMPEMQKFFSGQK